MALVLQDADRDILMTMLVVFTGIAKGSSAAIALPAVVFRVTSLEGAYLCELHSYLIPISYLSSL